MPKLQPTETEQANRVAKACIVGNQQLYGIDNEQLSLKMRCSEQTVRKRLHAPSDFTLEELRSIAKQLKLTPLQCASIIMGRPLTSKEVKEFLML